MDKITCPNCGTDFDAEQALSTKIQENLQKEYEQKLKQQFAISKRKEEEKVKELNAEKEKLEQEKVDFEKKKEQENKLFTERLEKEKQKLKEIALKQSEEEVQAKLKALEEENLKRKQENDKLKDKELELLKQQNILKEQSENYKREVQKELLEKQQKIEEKARMKERESFELKEKEWQKRFEDQKKIVEEMKRKAEQSSMQMQGEVQELALEEMLQTTYPFDQIEEVPKGIRGADCIQIVYNNFQQECGSIVYESKRTKNFSKDWIDKLKQDQINCKANIAVLVTETLPSDVDGFMEYNGVWVCGFNQVKNVSFILRQMLIKMHSVKKQEENKGDKMQLLYSYFTSSEFVQTVKRILENQQKMKEHLAQEQRAYAKIWKQREKQIWTVEENISALFGSISGITGREIEGDGLLELPDGDL